MDQVISKTAKNTYFTIGFILVLGALPLFLEEHIIPNWVCYVMWGFGLLLIFMIKTTVVTKNEIAVSFITGRKPKTIKKADITGIVIKIKADTLAQRIGMMKKDRVLQIRGTDKFDIIYLSERFDSGFNEVVAFLQQNYSEYFKK